MNPSRIFHSHCYLPGLHRFFLFLISSLCLLTPILSHAIDFGWSRTDKSMIYGEMTNFDFKKKIVTIKDAESGKEKSFPSSQLDTRARWMLILFSSQFFSSIPEDTFGAAHLPMAIVFIVLPAILYLIIFWLCAMLIMRKFSPMRALVALPGAWFLSGFLIIFYLFMIGRFEEKALLICILGGLVTLTVASLFISIIYNRSVFHGLTLIILHSVLTPLIVALTIFIPYQFSNSEKIDTFFEDHVFIPIGALPVKEVED